MSRWLCGVALTAALAGDGLHFHVGRTPTPDEVRGQDITVFPDGAGLPEGTGTAEQGRALYQLRCASCHGDHGEGRGDYPRLAGGQGTVSRGEPILTVGSYWPYATTVWDYIRRAMPYDNPGSLRSDEVYAITAYVLHLSDIVGSKETLNLRTLPAVRMPNRDGFIPDFRPLPQRRSGQLCPATLGCAHTIPPRN